MSEKLKKILGYCIIIAIGVAVIAIAEQYRSVANFAGDPTSAFLPQLCGGLMILLSVILIIRTLLSHRAAPQPVPAASDPTENNKQDGEEVSPRARKLDFLRGMSSILLLLFLVLTYDKLGFLIASVIYLFGQQLLVSDKGNRHWVRTIVISIVVPVFCYFFFVKFLNYMLPMGILR